MAYSQDTVQNYTGINDETNNTGKNAEQHSRNTNLVLTFQDEHSREYQELPIVEEHSVEESPMRIIKSNLYQPTNLESK